MPAAQVVGLPLSNGEGPFCTAFPAQQDSAQDSTHPDAFDKKIYAKNVPKPTNCAWFQHVFAFYKEKSVPFETDSGAGNRT